MTEAVGLRAPRIYNLFPLLAGSIPEWSRHIRRVREMGFNWIQVNPFHYPGFSGSLYAVKDYYRLNPLLRGNAYASDDDLLRGFIETAGAHGLGVMMDLVLAHTAKDSALVHEHPEWFAHDAEGFLLSRTATAENPEPQRAISGDLALLDFTPRPHRDALVESFCMLVRYYTRLGIRGFRCMMAHRIPADVWSAIKAAAHQEDPDVLFFAETLGGTPEDLESLRPARFDYVYNSAKWWDGQAPWLLEQYQRLRTVAPSVSFPESHDTPRLVAENQAAGVSSVRSLADLQRYRYLFSAFFSAAVSMPVGYEFGFARPLNAVTTRPEQWESTRFDISGYIGSVNRLKASLGVLNHEAPQHRLESPSGAFALVRNDGEEWAVLVINPRHNGTACLSFGSDPIGQVAAMGRDVTPSCAGMERSDPSFQAAFVLRPGEMRVFAGDSLLSLSSPVLHQGAEMI